MKNQKVSLDQNDDYVLVKITREVERNVTTVDEMRAFENDAARIARWLIPFFTSLPSTRKYFSSADKSDPHNVLRMWTFIAPMKFKPEK